MIIIRNSLPLEKNFRDLSCIVNQSVPRLKEHTLFRSGSLENCLTCDHFILEELGIQTVIDFRSKEERYKKPEIQNKNMHFIHLPIDNKHLIANSNTKYQDIGKKEVERSYSDLALSQNSNISYRTFFDILLTERPGILFHCSAGKDRTGFASFLLLSALGIDLKTIVEDFLYSNTCLALRTQRIMKEERARGLNNKHLESLYWQLTVHESYLTSTILEIEKIFGSVDEYLEMTFGLTTFKRDLLKDKFLHF